VVTTAGNYWVTVTVNECKVSDTIHIKKCPEFTYFYFPSAFTPNGDGLNDIFRPTGNDIVDFHLMVFDRWGQMLFETYDPGLGWDGKSNGQYAEPGIYTYVATYGSTDNPVETVKTTGTFTLVR
jgi:gliding motility-associated-like protein